MNSVESQACNLQLSSQGLLDTASETTEGSSQYIFSYFQTYMFKWRTSSLIELVELELENLYYIF